MSRFNIAVVFVALMSGAMGFYISKGFSAESQDEVLIKQAEAKSAAQQVQKEKAKKQRANIQQLSQSPELMLGDELVTLERWKGKVVLVNFWASWCPPCIREMPELSQIQGYLGVDGLQIVGVADDDFKKATAFLDEYPVEYPILFEGSAGSMAKFSRDMGNSQGVLPYTVLFDRQGYRVSSYRGLLRMKELRKDIMKLL